MPRTQRPSAAPLSSLRMIVADQATCCTVECDRKGKLSLRFIKADSDDPTLRQFGSREIALDVTGALSANPTDGCFHLITHHLGSRLPAPLSFLREFTKAVYTHWILAYRATGALPGDSPSELIQAWAVLASQVPGLESMGESTLRGLWADFRVSIRHSMKLCGTSSILDFLRPHSEEWADVGKPYIKLYADVDADEAERPFALMAGYGIGLTAKKVSIGNPIANAIFGETHVPGLGRHYLGLLRRAGEVCGVVERLLDSQEIFGMCPLIPRDAHTLLRDAPAIRELGLGVYVPMWWRDYKPPSIGVKTRIGTARPRPVASRLLLDLRTSFVVGEEELTESEWRQVVRSSLDGLVFLRGKWLVLDRGEIDASIAKWKRTEELRARGGVTYAEALELTGARVGRSSDAAQDEHATSATGESFCTGPWLEEALTAIARHDLRREADPGVLLHGQLRGYQRQGAAWLSLMIELGLGACLADDMGLGKSCQVITLILALLKREDRGPHLLVVPASLITNWLQEIDKWARGLDVGIVHGSGEEPTDPPVLTITSYDTLKRRPALQGRDWGLVVLDEAQTIKNPETQASKAVKALKSKMRVVLTGTPVENDLSDLWSIMDFLNPGYLADLDSFRAWIGGLPEGPERYARVREKIRPFILRRLKTDPDVAPDLPTKVVMPVYCALTATQANLYAQAYEACKVELRGADGSARYAIALSLWTYLKQVCNHPAHYTKSGNYDPGLSGKFARLTQIAGDIAERREKALIFTQFQEIAAPLAAHLARIFGGPGIVLDGKVSVKQRQALVTQFQDEDGPPFAVMTYKVGGTGFNLTAASHVILFDRWYNPAVENQAIDRAHRIGQTKGVVVHKFITRGTLEETIDERLRIKRGVAAGVIPTDEGEGLGVGRLSPEELLSLAALDPVRVREEHVGA